MNKGLQRSVKEMYFVNNDFCTLPIFIETYLKYDNSKFNIHEIKSFYDTQIPYSNLHICTFFTSAHYL
jgi:hypothetical protein